MKSRGYSHTSEIVNSKRGPVLCFAKQVAAIESALHANVELNAGTIELDFLELKYFCRLSTGRFDFFHKDFDKYEQIIYTYAAQCMSIDVFTVLDSWKVQRDGVSEEEAEDVKPKKTIKDRKLAFWNEIVPVAKKRGYDKKECIKFYNHWTQMNPGGKKMWFEKLRATKTFDTGKRLTTWFSNAENFKFEKRDRTEKIADKQNQALKQRDKSYDPKTLF